MKRAGWVAILVAAVWTREDLVLEEQGGDPFATRAKRTVSALRRAPASLCSGAGRMISPA